MALPAGTRLGRYEIRTPLGAGGMGEVYLGWDPDLEREVAVKVLRSDREESPDRVRRFVQEAKAASGLNHPNVAHVYEIGSEDGLRFIVMEVVSGETLRRRIARGEMPIDDVLSLGTQIAAGLAAAHQAGIVHRDIKPENVIVRPDGYVKILDFGLAKLSQSRDPNAETLVRTQSGVAVGTLHYMAPEQFAGSDVTAAADVFSLGVVLFEMLTGRRPFEGDSASAVATAILSQPPASAGDLRLSTPPHLDAVITRALQKDPAKRYPSAGEVLEELKLISRETTVSAIQSSSALPMQRRAMAVIAAVVVVALGVSGVMMYRRSQREKSAREAVTSAERLLAKGQYADAYYAAAAALPLLPGDPRVREVVSRSSTRATFESDPPGATVLLQRFGSAGAALRAGTTPLTIEQLPKADYVVTMQKDGYAPMSRVVAAGPRFLRGWEMRADAIQVQAKLLDAKAVPPGMVHVGGGPYRLFGFSRLSDREMDLSDFFIDRFEVSNRDFEEFVRAGGYRRRELWEHPFVEDGRTLSFEEAMSRFRDTSGLAGPRHWSGGAPPKGTENHPVTHVSWYEAAAFARWKGKALPTVFEWDKAGRYPLRYAVGLHMPWGLVSEGTDVTERANFAGQGTMPVDSMPFGASHWGVHHMAGNVAEWCLNRFGSGFATRGGSWNDAVYAFGRTAALPPMFANDRIGFRCVKAVDPARDQGAFELSADSDIPIYKPVDDRTFERIRQRYEYAKPPLNVRVVETIETTSWRREHLLYEVAGKVVPAYLWTPKGFKPPFQVIHFSPAGDVTGGHRALEGSAEGWMGGLIRGGRAVFSVVLEGYIGRPKPPDGGEPDSRSDAYVDDVVGRVIELRRGLDVLAARKDIDMSRVAFIGPSAGSYAGVILTAVEPRYRSVLFIGTRVLPDEVSDAAGANRINFAPRIAAPKMMLQGRYDESAPLENAAEPLFRLLREPKRLEIYEGTHVPPTDLFIQTTTRWLDETVGPVSP